MPTRDEALTAAARIYADGLALRDSMTPADAAAAAWRPGGPSVEELEERIRAQRAQAGAA